MTYSNYRIYVKNRIDKNSIPGENGCIEYAGGKLKHKYGLISITLDMVRKSVPAHRAMYMAVNNCLDLPSNIHIRHTCDNPCCVNIDHLVRGTPADNMQDCIERRRRTKKYRYHKRVRIFNDDIIKAIRNEPDNIKQFYIAEKYGVSPGYVSKIRNGKAKTLVT